MPWRLRTQYPNRQPKMTDLLQFLEQHIFSGYQARTSMVLAYQKCQFDNTGQVRSR